MKRFIIVIDELLLEALNRKHGYASDPAESIAWAIYERDLRIDLPSNLVKVIAEEKVLEHCYGLCEGCQGRKDGHDPLVQNYLDELLQ